MNTNTSENTSMQEMYEKYMQKAQEAFQEVNRFNKQRFLPWRLLGLLPFLAAIILFLIGGWDSVQSALTLLLITSILVVFVLLPVIMAQSGKAFQAKGTEIAQTLPGFDGFFDLYRKEYWPTRFPSSGKRYERFISLVKGANVQNT